MRFYFSWKVTLICSLLMVGMLRLSWWQWDRHLAKQEYIRMIGERLAEPPVPLAGLTNQSSDGGSLLPYRRVQISGTYDFEHEIVLRNRRYEEEAGAYVLTPLKLDDGEKSILVSRGFIPIEKMDREARRIYQTPPRTTFVGLLKEPSSQRLFAPQDPDTGPSLPWVDAWLRVDLAKIQNQIPYPILPLWVEIMSTDDSATAQKKILTSPSKRDEMLFLPLEAMARESRALKEKEPASYPVPVFDTVVPPGRHLGYVYEWALMALMTLCIGLVIQLRPSRQRQISQEKIA